MDKTRFTERRYNKKLKKENYKIRLNTNKHQLQNQKLYERNKKKRFH